jgi:hypothetical protein
LTYKLDDLGDMLLKDFAGKRHSMRKIFEEHNIGKRYIIENYKEVLRLLEAEGKIVCSQQPKNGQNAKERLLSRIA